MIYYNIIYLSTKSLFQKQYIYLYTKKLKGILFFIAYLIILLSNTNLVFAQSNQIKVDEETGEMFMSDVSVVCEFSEATSAKRKSKKITIETGNAYYQYVGTGKDGYLHGTESISLSNVTKEYVSIGDVCQRGHGLPGPELTGPELTIKGNVTIYCQYWFAPDNIVLEDGAILTIYAGQSLIVNWDSRSCTH